LLLKIFFLMEGVEFKEELARRKKDGYKQANLA
jgi:Na+/H+ antiporter NhaA